jgi:2-succinyl-5-enolpyruvyl-6-hydroxy-3-cyclohexene-1-carboxylate synthase
MPWDPELAALRETLLERCAVLADVLSPLAGDGVEQSADRWIRSGAPMPDLLLTLGGPTMSKAFREQVRKEGIPHWHLGDDRPALDVFGQLQGQIPGPPAEALASVLEAMPGFNTYAAEARVRAWGLESRHRQAVAEAPFSDLVVWDGIARAVPEGAVVHLANSTAARYAQLTEWRAHRLHANRGVAGIDGCTSTAVGDALAHPDVPVVLVTGDQAFFYDLNGLWVRPLPRNLSVIVVNNGGGGIFRWLPGPAESGLLEPCFEADLGRDVGGAAASVGAEHRAVGESDWEAGLRWVLAPSNLGALRLLEVRTDGATSAEVYARYGSVWSINK